MTLVSIVLSLINWSKST